MQINSPLDSSLPSRTGGAFSGHAYQDGLASILVISKREVTRLRTRFTGRSRLFIIAILALAVILSGVIYQQDFTMSKGLYTIGVSPDALGINDERFNIVPLDFEIGHTKLSNGEIDAYVDGDTIMRRRDDRSQYAVGALAEYLQKQELFRISEEYDIDQAFPLRIETRHIPTEREEQGGETPVVLSDILKSEQPAEEPHAMPEAESSVTSETDVLVVPEPETAVIPEPAQAFEPAPADPAGGDAVASMPAPPLSASDEAVVEQLQDFYSGSALPEFKAEFVSDEEIIIPSLSKPPIPLSQVLLAFLYIVPIFFVSVFFTSSFMEEKTNRKLVILLSAPITPLQIILGKMLPYIVYSVIAIVAITLMLRGSVLLGLAIFVPVMLFILSIYLMVALLYRTFKDQTFFSVLAVWIITAYLVAPAMFAGVNDLSYISPLTLAVQMYQGESFGLAEYFLSTIPLYAIFLATMFVGVRVFNEEYLMGFRPLYKKLGEAVYLAIDRSHLNVSVFALSSLLVPVVFMVQFASIVIASNLSTMAALTVIFVLSIIAEEIAKSIGIVVLLQNKAINSVRGVIKFSFISALGFLIAEKLLLFLALSVMSESMFIDAVFSSGLLLLPLALHFVTTSVVCFLTARLGIKYFPLGLVAGSVVHGIYNLCIIGGEIF
ncbi:MAG: ABC transporter permease [Chloroflexota bacterium]|nr:ABC transporter permease [Chloroflexota bacterium]